MMQSRKRDVYNAVRTELEASNISFQFEDTKRHSRFLFKIGGKEMIYVIARSPSDFNARKNARGDVRRMIRQNQPLKERV